MRKVVLTKRFSEKLPAFLLSLDQLLYQLEDPSISYSIPFSFQTVKQLKADNQRLKDENGALVRVISKLSK